ncbi:hypothetical protein SESBI_01568 [Sesbania bispinosa]|nr:hypothetical protein SESBI_01568 [Sesbania bispinosa]
MIWANRDKLRLHDNCLPRPGDSLEGVLGLRCWTGETQGGLEGSNGKNGTAAGLACSGENKRFSFRHPEWRPGS